MLFIAFAIAISIGLALLISADVGSFVGLDEWQTGTLIPMIVLLVVFASGLFARRYRFSELIGNALLWVCVCGIAALGYTYRYDLQNAAARVFGELVPGQAIVASEGGLVSFRSGRDGHFQINARINGEYVPTIFDTGASAVVLTHEDAVTAGIDTDRLTYDVPVSTANGTGRAANVTLDEINVGGIVRRRVQAFVADRGALETSLLGMTFLRTLSGYSVSGTQLQLTD